MNLHLLTAREIAGRIRSRDLTATAAVTAALARIAAQNGAVNAFTTVTEARALARAGEIDAMIAQGADPGPLAGVPFAAKNLFDVAGVVTLAGSIIEQRRAPATQDGFAVAAMERAGAICVGCLNMDEYAYGVTTENTHYGPCRNPHDPSRVAGGSSGGSGAAVAAGLVPLSLGTDTNGSIRVPASLNGIWGIKPTYGRLSRAGGVMFVPSLDHVGPFARSVADLALAYEAMQGEDQADPAQSWRGLDRVSGLLDQGIGGLRIARLGGHFARHGHAYVQNATDHVAEALGARGTVEIKDAAAGRAAAFLITASEGANQHLDDLRTQPNRFEPLTRDRLLAGAMLPAQWVIHAQRVRSQYRQDVLALFRHWDILVAPATPSVATPIGQAMLEADGQSVPLRPSFGVYTQPISCIGLPVIAAPLQGVDGVMPLGVQLIAAPWAEATLFRAAAELERAGLCMARVAPEFV
jgi:Asp-tRNA(Asn)/Glu-tRNA(Gln) amidotransferase A subunit family amidase